MTFNRRQKASGVIRFNRWVVKHAPSDSMTGARELLRQRGLQPDKKCSLVVPLFIRGDEIKA